MEGMICTPTLQVPVQNGEQLLMNWLGVRADNLDDNQQCKKEEGGIFPIPLHASTTAQEGSYQNHNKNQTPSKQIRHAYLLPTTHHAELLGFASLSLRLRLISFRERHRLWCFMMMPIRNNIILTRKWKKHRRIQSAIYQFRSGHQLHYTVK